jgi:GT2 family glycosyltransferase
VSGSLILASRNRPDLLADTVASILRCDPRPDEVIVVDQSDRPHPDLARHPDIRYLWSESRGLSRANNLGTRAALRDYLVFTHDDVLVDPAWYGFLLEALLRGGPRTVVTGRVLAADPEPGAPEGFAPSLNPSTAPAVYEGPDARDVIWPMSLALCRPILQEIGGFDERLGPGTPYPAAEDNDLCRRLLEAGCRIVFEPAAVVHHRAWRPWSEHASLRYDYGRGQGAFYAKHRDLRRLTGDVAHRLARLGRSGRTPREEFAYVRGLLSAAWQWSRREGRRG